MFGYLQKVTVIMVPLHYHSKLRFHYEYSYIVWIICTALCPKYRFLLHTLLSIVLTNSRNYHWKSVEKIAGNGSKISSLTCPLFLPEEIEKISYGDLWWEWKNLYLTFSSRKTWQFFKHYHLETLSWCLQSKILDLAAYNSTYQ